VHIYGPDFIIRLKTGNLLGLETNGQHADQDRPKRAFLYESVKAVNGQSGFGMWS
jgi:type III restriction enzyme